MTALTKGMFGHQFESKSPAFGIRCGQMRRRDFIHNGGWYNRAGEKLGFGDLEPSDIQKISAELEDGELFIVLGERDSFWNFVENIGTIGSMCTTKPTEQSPGQKYVSDKCRLIIARGELYFVDEYGTMNKDIYEVDDLKFKVIKRKEAVRIIAS